MTGLTRRRPARSKGSRPRADANRYPPISDYALIADCHSAALVSRSGSIDWCCMPRLDAGSVFGRLLRWDDGGYCSVAPATQSEVSRRYLEDTLVLETTFRTGGGEVRLFDCMTMRRGGAEEPYQQILRVVEGVRGQTRLRAVVCPRFDYGEVTPWIRQHAVRCYSAIGGNDALVVQSDADIAPGRHDLEATFTVRPGERIRLSITFVRPEDLDSQSPPEPLQPEDLDRRLDETIKWWRRWASKVEVDERFPDPITRSAIVLKSLSNAPTGAIAAAPTTSLPEVPGGQSNWDYRYTWIRDSSFAVRSLADLGCEAEADGFRRFVERSAAGNAHDLQVLYGVGGERRLPELVLGAAEGYRGAKPVRVGNAAATQLQLDVYGELLDLSWRWHLRGHSPDDDYWRFIVDLVEAAATRWPQPDQGLWEDRGRARHYVHSKVMCWAALDRGIRLAEECLRSAPTRRWTQIRDRIRRAIERNGYDPARGVFVRVFDGKAVDAALLLLPVVDFVAWDDERMVRTADAVRRRLDDHGLLRRYPSRSGSPREGAFLPASFWLVECLARQGRQEEAQDVFDRTMATANDLGLFSEEFDTLTGEMLGNFPQALTHLSHISAALALREADNRA